MTTRLPLLLLFITACHAQELLKDPRCNLPMDRGKCLQFSVNWYYDRYSHRCRQFYYGGCEGNSNRFRSLEECSTTCHYVEPSNRDRCLQPHDPGHCDSDIERWYFDKDKQQCVCSWWSGCGGNSNLYFSYNHCMLVCGEFAKRGPGIDEKYWRSRNTTHYVPPVYGGGRPPQQPARPHSSREHTERGHSQPRYGQTVDQRTTMDYEELKRLHEEYYRRHPTTPVTPQRTWHEQTDYRSRDHSIASQYAEFRSSSSQISSSQSRSYPYSSISHGRHRAGSQFSSNPSRALGERIYRYDTGPIRRTHPNGTVTIKRQVIYITENRQPTLKLHQRLPGLIEFTHITPPPPFSTMIPPLIRRRLKKLLKKKIPTRTIDPPVTATSIQHQRNYARPDKVIQDNETLPTIARVTISSTVTPHLDYIRRRHPPSQESDETRSIFSPISVPTAPYYPPRHRPQPKEVVVKPLIVETNHLVPTTLAPTIRVEAERIDTFKPVVISVSPKKVDFDEVLKIDSKVYDDYEDTFDESNYLDNTNFEHPVEATSTPVNEIPSSMTQSHHQTLAPIVSPPAGYHPSPRADGEHSTSIPSSPHSQTFYTTSPRRSSVEEPSSTHRTFVDEYTENVEFEIQPVGVDN